MRFISNDKNVSSQLYNFYCKLISDTLRHDFLSSNMFVIKIELSKISTNDKSHLSKFICNN